MTEKKGNRRKAIRYFRWSIKAAFLIIFTIPVVYLVGSPTVPVYSLSNGLSQPLLGNPFGVGGVPLGQSVCTIWLGAFGIILPGNVVICPLGVAQTLLAGTVASIDIIRTIIGMFLFLIPIFALGNLFCGWACPVGTLIDSFDKGVEIALPKVNEKREERRLRNKMNRSKEEQKFSVACKSCPFGKLASRFGIVGQGVLASSLVGSAIFKIPVFCTICPFGILSRGTIHLATLMSITGRVLPVIIELYTIPIAAVLVSFREKRFWCKKMCPMGSLLNMAGSVSPLVRPDIKEGRCVMKGCPTDCKDYRMDYCFMCRQMDDKNCEKVCPYDIRLTDKESLSRCTKCLECYISCDRDAVEIKLTGKPDAIPTLTRFFKRKPKKQSEKTAC